MFTQKRLRAALDFAQTENPKLTQLNDGIISKQQYKQAMSSFPG